MTGNLGEVPQISAARENCLPKRFYAILWQSNSQNTGYFGVASGIYRGRTGYKLAEGWENAAFRCTLGLQQLGAKFK
jgi:hypothetical protein